MNNNNYYKVIKSLPNGGAEAEIFDQNDRLVELRVFDMRIESLPLWRAIFCSNKSNKKYLFKAAHKYADSIIELCKKYETNISIVDNVSIAPFDE